MINPFDISLRQAVALATISLAALPAGRLHAQTAPAAPAAPAPAAPASVTLNGPAMSQPLALNPSPYAIDVGRLGKWYVGGVLSGLGLVQSQPLPSDSGGRFDISNGQIFVQKVDGIVQFYAQGGVYSFPTVGTAYVTASNALHDYYGVVPYAYLKLVPSSAFNIEAGKLPTLIGDEANFSFENIDIERGLLWNQEPAVSKGVQASYTVNTVTVNASLTDGYYSGVYNWLTGSASWTMNSASTLAIAAGGNLGHTDVSTFATPLAQNNSSIYNLIYTYSNGPLYISPYLQASVVDKNAQLGFDHSATTYGGAVLANYAFTPKFSLGGRVEYLTTDGSAAEGAPNLLYGQGSKAFSLTVTPTYQFNRFYVRADVSYVTVGSLTAGDGFGKNGTDKNQVRGLVEVGVLF